MRLGGALTNDHAKPKGAPGKHNLILGVSPEGGAETKPSRKGGIGVSEIHSFVRPRSCYSPKNGHKNGQEHSKRLIRPS